MPPACRARTASSLRALTAACSSRSSSNSSVARGAATAGSVARDSRCRRTCSSAEASGPMHTASGHLACREPPFQTTGPCRREDHPEGLDGQSGRSAVRPCAGRARCEVTCSVSPNGHVRSRSGVVLLQPSRPLYGRARPRLSHAASPSTSANAADHPRDPGRTISRHVARSAGKVNHTLVSGSRATSRRAHPAPAQPAPSTSSGARLLVDLPPSTSWGTGPTSPPRLQA